MEAVGRSSLALRFRFAIAASRVLGFDSKSRAQEVHPSRGPPQAHAVMIILKLCRQHHQSLLPTGACWYAVPRHRTVPALPSRGSAAARADHARRATDQAPGTWVLGPASSTGTRQPTTVSCSTRYQQIFALPRGPFVSFTMYTHTCTTTCTAMYCTYTEHIILDRTLSLS